MRGQSVKYLMPDEVIDYINEQRLYLNLDDKWFHSWDQENAICILAIKLIATVVVVAAATLL